MKDINIKMGWLVYAGFLSRLLGLSLIEYEVMLSLMGLLVFILFFVINRNIFGSFILVVGGSLNALVIFLNKGMPVDPTLSTDLNLSEITKAGLYHSMDENTVLPFLGDWIYPKGFSPGDVFVIVGFLSFFGFIVLKKFKRLIN